HPRVVGTQHGRRPLAHLPLGGAAGRGADDLRRHARVARAVVRGDVRRRDDQRALGPGIPDPRCREFAALRPDVGVAALDRHTRLRRRPPAARRACPPARLAGGAGVRFALVVLLLVAWEAAARSGLWSPLLFPSLASIASELGRLLASGEFLFEAWVT